MIVRWTLTLVAAAGPRLVPVVLALGMAVALWGGLALAPVWAAAGDAPGVEPAAQPAAQADVAVPFPIAEIAAVSGGGGHTCALTTGGGVKCWGRNDYGQIGDGSRLTRTLPVDVSGLISGVVAVRAGNAHTCALTDEGGVKCWGQNTVGQLGDGSTISRTTPVDVSGLTSGVISITAGGFHTCALTDSGGVKCWGYGLYGQVGVGDQDQHETPVDVSGLTAGVVDVSAGLYHTCALLTDGSAQCWGYGLYGQLGNDSDADQLTPVPVNDLPVDAQRVHAGAFHTCVLTTGGGVRCWGANVVGQLGDGTTEEREDPVVVNGLADGVVEVAAGDAHTCALKENGAVMCWGRGTEGQLGDGSTALKTPEPVTPTGLTAGIAALGSGAFHSCGVTTSGGLECWGQNQFGQLGNGTQVRSTTPTDVMTLVTCYMLTLTHSGAGFAPAATPNQTAGCPASHYLPGEVIGLTATPAAGQAVLAWSGTDDDSAEGLTNTLTMPALDHTVSVTYSDGVLLFVPIVRQ